MLKDHEDWQAQTPTIILDTPGIRAKECHTDKELKVLTRETLSVTVSYPSATWDRAYTDGSADDAMNWWKMAEVEFSSSSVTTQLGSLWLQGSSQQTTELCCKYPPSSMHPFLGSEPGRDTPGQQCSWLTAGSILQSLKVKSPWVGQIFHNIWQELSLLHNIVIIIIIFFKKWPWKAQCKTFIISSLRCKLSLISQEARVQSSSCANHTQHIGCNMSYTMRFKGAV